MNALRPLMIVMLPLVAFSAMQLGLPVLAPTFVAEAGLAPEAVGIVVVDAQASAAGQATESAVPMPLPAAAVAKETADLHDLPDHDHGTSGLDAA